MGNQCGCGTPPPHQQLPVAQAPPPPEPIPAPKGKRASLQVALESYERVDQHGPGSEYRPHRCTDCSCCFLFLAAIVSFVMITLYAHEHGDTRKLHHGLDFHGNICGVDASVADKPFLYWCPDSPEDDPGIGESIDTSEAAAAPPEETAAVAPEDISPTGRRLQGVAPEAQQKLDDEDQYAMYLFRQSKLELPGNEPGRDLGARESARESLGAPRGLDGGEQQPQEAGEVPSGDDSFRPATATETSGAHWLARSAGVSLNLRYPMCVERCPTSSEGSHSCFRKKSKVTKEVVDESTGTFVEKQIFNFEIVEDYPTMRVAHYCLPADMGMRRSLGGVLDDSQEAFVYHLSQVRQAYPVVAAAACFSVILGFAYLFLLGLCPGCLTFLTFAGAVLLPLSFGGISLWGWYMEDEQHKFLEEHERLQLLQLPATGDSNWDLGVSVGLISLGLAILLVACCCFRNIRLSVRSVDAACDCLLSVPSLLFEPFMNVIVQLASLFVLAKGMLLLISCGEVSHLSHISVTFLNGLSRSFVYHDWEYLYIFVYVCVALWVWEFGAALQKFVVAHCAQIWYFAEYRDGRKFVPCCALLNGVCVGLTYHMGTLALGALCIPPFRLMHWLHSVFLRPGDSEDDRGNAVSECLISCCTCCWACWEGFIKFMTSNAYIVVAIDSYPFFPASQKAYNSDMYQIENLGDPNGFMWIFQLWGLLVISGLTATFTWLLTTTFDEFNTPGLPHYIENPVPITAVGGALGLLIGLTFMHVLKNIADTIVFCYALEREWHEERGLPMRNNVPHSLQSYLDSNGSRTMALASSKRSLMRQS